MKMTKLLALVLVIALAVCAFAACGGNDTEEPKTNLEGVNPDTGDDSNVNVDGVDPAPVATELGKTTLVMGTNAEFEPFEYRDNDEIVGYDVETAKAIADFVDMDFDIEDMAFDSLITALNSGQIDMVVAGMSVTEERLEEVNFSNPYYRAAQVIIVPKEGATVASSADLAGKKIGVQEGTTGDIYVEENVENADLNRFKKAVDAAIDLANGRLDAVVLDEQPALRIVAQNDALTVLDEALTEEEYAIAVRKDNPELLNAINACLDDLAETGKKDELLEKYGLSVDDAE